MAKEKEAKNKKETKNKKSFFKDFKAELKKVIWPTPKQLINSTIAVVVIVIITAAIVLALDLVFDLFNKKGINKLKSKVRGYEVVEVQNQTENETLNTVETNTTAEELEISNEVVEEINETTGE